MEQSIDVDQAAAEGGDDQQLAELRQPYGHDQLDEHAVDQDPIAQFRHWLDDALNGPIVEPNAMVVATATLDGVPTARTVLLKALDERGFVFYTNYRSDKAAEMEANPRAALVFPWHPMERQVRVVGPVARIAAEESDAYFASRPRESQLGAWASPQSDVVADRAALDAAYDEVVERFGDDGVIARPEHWGGYRVEPEAVEFWQGRTGRLHDRLRYRRTPEGWALERLAP